MLRTLLLALTIASTLNIGGLTIPWEPFVGTASDGSPLRGELGRVRVPECRARPDGPSIEIAVVRYPTTHPNPGPPVMFLAGGPGGSGVDLASVVATHPQIRLLEQCDVIGLDQRGTGRTIPTLLEPEFVENLPLDTAPDRAATVDAFARVVERCVSYWRSRDVQLESYNSVESADDVDAVRDALGVDRVVLVGTSYGSHLGLSYLRRHPEHVARAIFSRVEGPDDTWKRPSTVQWQLDRLRQVVAADATFGTALPNLTDSVRELLRQLDAKPMGAVARRGTPNETDIVVGAFDLRCFLAQSLATSEGVARIPVAIEEMLHGRWDRLAENALDDRRISIRAMPLFMDCASGGTRARLEIIERERADQANVLGDAIMAPFFPEACESCGMRDLGDEFRASFGSDVPVLFVSGSLDVRTPQENVDAIGAGFPNHVHVIVRNAGHESRELMSEEFRTLYQAFLRGEAIQGCVLTLPEVRFTARTASTAR